MRERRPSETHIYGKCGSGLPRALSPGNRRLLRLSQLVRESGKLLLGVKMGWRHQPKNERRRIVLRAWAISSCHSFASARRRSADPPWRFHKRPCGQAKEVARPPDLRGGVVLAQSIPGTTMMLDRGVRGPAHEGSRGPGRVLHRFWLARAFLLMLGFSSLCAVTRSLPWVTSVFAGLQVIEPPLISQ